MSNIRQIVLEKWLNFESEQVEKKQKVEKEIRKIEIDLKK